jgi:hypothetical protein
MDRLQESVVGVTFLQSRAAWIHEMKEIPMTKVVRLVLGASALVVPLALFVASASAQDGAVEKELMQKERDWCTAQLKRDPAMLAAIVADDVTDISRDGKLGDKAGLLEGIRNGNGTACEVDQMKVRVYGDAAVITGRSTIASPSFTGQALWTDTFVKRGGKWLCVATQSSAVKK